MGSVIEICRLTYQVGKTEILHDCNMSVDMGDIMCIIGPNGSGKTTLLNCLLGFYSPPKNTVFLQGIDIKQLRRNQIASQISFVQQVSQIESSLSVNDYLSLGRIAHKRIYERLNHDDMNIIEKVVVQTGIDRLLNKSRLYLSGGEKQLVMIARALIQDTNIIVMDEPDSALDFGNQSVLMQLIKKLNQAGKTILFTTHNPNHSLALKSRVCIMNEGQVQRIGSYEQCICPEVLENVYGNGLKFISASEGVVCTFNID